MRPCRSGSRFAMRPFSASRTISTASRRPAGAFQPACERRGHLSRRALPAAYRSRSGAWPMFRMACGAVGGGTGAVCSSTLASLMGAPPTEIWSLRSLAVGGNAAAIGPWANPAEVRGAGRLAPGRRRPGCRLSAHTTDVSLARAATTAYALSCWRKEVMEWSAKRRLLPFASPRWSPAPSRAPLERERSWYWPGARETLTLPGVFFSTGPISRVAEPARVDPVFANLVTEDPLGG